jgi:hypothetical protein
VLHDSIPGLILDFGAPSAMSAIPAIRYPSPLLHPSQIGVELSYIIPGWRRVDAPRTKLTISEVLRLGLAICQAWFSKIVVHVAMPHPSAFFVAASITN